MSSSNFMFLLAILLIVSAINCAKKQDDFGDGVSPPNPQGCTNCSICQYPGCRTPPQAPPPPAEYPSYGTPPPPAAPAAPVGGCTPAAPVGNCPPPPPPPPPAQGQCVTGQNPPPYPYSYLNESAASPLAIPLNPSSNISSAFIFLLVLLVSVCLV